MAFDRTQPFTVYVDDVGNILWRQNGVYYRQDGVTVVDPLPTTMPSAIYVSGANNPYPSMQLDCLKGGQVIIGPSFSRYTFDQICTFTNASATSCTTYFGSDGLLRTMGRNELLNSAWVSPTGLGSYPTGWVVAGSDGTALTTNGDGSVSIRRIQLTGFCGLQRASGAIDGITTGVQYTISASIRIPTGVVPADCYFYSGSGVPGTVTLASAATLSTAQRDVWIRYSAQVTFTTIPNALSFVANNAAVGAGFDIRQPQIELGSTANPYSYTTSAANSGARFDYDPGTPAGTTGGELITNGNFSYGGNYVSYSQDFTNVVWQVGNDALPVTQVSNATYPAPDGSRSATLMTPGIIGNVPSQIAAGAANRLWQEQSAGPAASTWTVSIWVKTYQVSSDVALFVNIRATDTAVGVTRFTTTDNWTRITATGTTTGGTTGIRFVVASKLPVLIWGAQAELGSTVSSYTPTTASAIQAPGWSANTSTGVGYAYVVNGGLSIFRQDASNKGGRVSDNFTTTAGKTYLVSFDVTNAAAWVYVTGMAGASYGVGTGRSFTFAAASSTSSIGLEASGDGSVTFIDNISVQEVVFTPKGQLIEEARTNLLLNSRDATNASWAKVNVTATRDQVGIDGAANSASKIVETAVTNTFAAMSSLCTVTASTAVTASAVVKAAGRNFAYLQINDGTSTNAAYAAFSLTTGAVTTAPTNIVGSLSAMSAVSTNLGGGWWRLAFTATLNTVANCNMYVGISNDGVTRSYAGTAGQGIIFDCAQLEVGAFATSIIVTGASTVTRAQDNESMTGSNFSSWYTQTAGTFVVEAIQGPNDGTSNRRIIQVSDGSATNVLALTRSSGGLAQFTSYVANVGDFITASGAPTQGAVTKAAIAYAASDKAVARDGAAPATGTVSPPLSGMNQMQIGSVVGGASTTFANTWIRKITYYPVRLPNAQLQALTA